MLTLRATRPLHPPRGRVRPQTKLARTVAGFTYTRVCDEMDRYIGSSARGWGNPSQAGGTRGRSRVLCETHRCVRATKYACAKYLFTASRVRADIPSIHTTQLPARGLRPTEHTTVRSSPRSYREQDMEVVWECVLVESADNTAASQQEGYTLLPATGIPLCWRRNVMNNASLFIEPV